MADVQTSLKKECVLLYDSRLNASLDLLVQYGMAGFYDLLYVTCVCINLWNLFREANILHSPHKHEVWLCDHTTINPARPPRGAIVQKSRRQNPLKGRIQSIRVDSLQEFRRLTASQRTESNLYKAQSC